MFVKFKNQKEKRRDKGKYHILYYIDLVKMGSKISQQRNREFFFGESNE